MWLAVGETTVLKRCASCHTVNRVQMARGVECRCGQCGSDLPLTHYDVLGLPYDASPSDIKSAYKRSIKIWHPDVHPNRELAQRQTQRILAAYVTLANPDTRGIYDSSLRGPSGQPKSTDNAKGFQASGVSQDGTSASLRSTAAGRTSNFYLALGGFTAFTLGGAILSGLSGSPMALFILLALSVIGAVQLLVRLFHEGAGS